MKRTFSQMEVFFWVTRLGSFRAALRCMAGPLSALKERSPGLTVARTVERHPDSDFDGPKV